MNKYIIEVKFIGGQTLEIEIEAVSEEEAFNLALPQHYKILNESSS